MLKVRSNQFQCDQYLNDNGIYDDEEIKELRQDWGAVEKKRSSIIKKIDALLLDFPINHNELTALRRERKALDTDIGWKQARLNAIVNRDQLNKRRLKKIEKLTDKIESVRKRTKELKDQK